MSNKEKKFHNEFNEFMSISSDKIPAELSKKIIDRIHKEMKPSPVIIFIKLFITQTLTGTFSLSICNQFGMNPFNTSFSLSEYFMRFGHSFCMFLCGLIFLGLGGVFAYLILKTEEIRILRKNVFIQIPVLSVVSLATFFFLGADFSFGIGVLWLIGAITGGTLSSEFNYRLSR